MEFRIADTFTEPRTESLARLTAEEQKAAGLTALRLQINPADDEVIPLQERIESIGDDADLREVYDTERHLLYVACTRARDRLLVTGVAPVSEFLDDFAT
jgi:hypothetical protein